MKFNKLLVILVIYISVMACRPLIPDDPDYSINDKTSKDDKIAVGDIDNKDKTGDTVSTALDPVTGEKIDGEYSKTEQNVENEKNPAEVKTPADQTASPGSQAYENGVDTTAGENIPPTIDSNPESLLHHRSILGSVHNLFTNLISPNSHIILEKNKGIYNQVDVFSGNDGSFSITVDSDNEVFYLSAEAEAASLSSAAELAGSASLKVRNALHSKLSDLEGAKLYTASEKELAKVVLESDSDSGATDALKSLPQGIVFFVYERTSKTTGSTDSKAPGFKIKAAIGSQTILSAYIKGTENSFTKSTLSNKEFSNSFIILGAGELKVDFTFVETAPAKSPVSLTLTSIKNKITIFDISGL